MNEYWTVERARHVVTYLIALREAGEDLRAAINLLHDGVPEDAQELTGEVAEDVRRAWGPDAKIWEWVEARHWITLVVIDTRAKASNNQRWIYVADVESVTVT